MGSVLILLFLHSSVLWTLSSGQTCYNSGSDAAGGICSRSRPCRVDHPFEDVECVPSRAPFLFPSSLPAGITRCPREGYNVFRCDALVPVNETLTRDSEISSVAVELNSIDFKRFAMNVSWNHSYNPTGGYELRVKRDNYLTECYCISNPDVRNLYLDDRMTYPPFLYRDTNSVFTIEVLLLSNALPEDDIKASVSSSWPSSCLDISHTSATCGLPIYTSPSDVTVHKKFSKSHEMILGIQWSYQTAYVHPTVYYIELSNAYDINDYFTFVTKNTNSIHIDHLAPSTQYIVHIQPYVHCSGLANRSYGLGCGDWSRPTSPVNYPKQHWLSVAKKH